MSLQVSWKPSFPSSTKRATQWTSNLNQRASRHQFFKTQSRKNKTRKSDSPAKRHMQWGALCPSLPGPVYQQFRSTGYLQASTAAIKIKQWTPFKHLSNKNIVKFKLVICWKYLNGTISGSNSLVNWRSSHLIPTFHKLFSKRLRHYHNQRSIKS